MKPVHYTSADDQGAHIPLSRPSITEEEKKAVNEVLSSGILSLGPHLPAFEKKVSEYLGVREAVGVSSGTAGLQLAFRALELEKGAEVITSPFTFAATAGVLFHEGLTPVFCDIDPVSLNLDPEEVEKKITAGTRALLPVHIFGLTADMDPIMETAARHDLAVIEDACEALGAVYRGRKAGTFGTSSVFAFYPNKQITTGEGGMIVTDQTETADRFRSLRNHGRTGKAMKFTEPGFNFRMNELSAALGVVQMERFEGILEARKQRAAWYREELQAVDGLTCMGGEDERSPFVFYVLFRNSELRDRTRAHLARNRIATGIYFPPLHLEEAFSSLNGKKGDFPVCEHTAATILALPFWTYMPHEAVLRTAECIKEALL